MVLIAEGASGQSFEQLKQVLHLPDDLSNVRRRYIDIKGALFMNSTVTELDVNQALFTNQNHPINNKYASILSHDYQVDHLPIDFQHPNDAAKIINEYFDSRTHGKIKHVVNPTDLVDIQLLLSSSIFFRGQWKVRFNLFGILYSEYIPSLYLSCSFRSM